MNDFYKFVDANGFGCFLVVLAAVILIGTCFWRLIDYLSVRRAGYAPRTPSDARVQVLTYALKSIRRRLRIILEDDRSKDGDIEDVIVDIDDAIGSEE